MMMSPTAGRPGESAGLDAVRKYIHELERCAEQQSKKHRRWKQRYRRSDYLLGGTAIALAGAASASAFAKTAPMVVGVLAAVAGAASGILTLLRAADRIPFHLKQELDYSELERRARDIGNFDLDALDLPQARERLRELELRFDAIKRRGARIAAE